MVLPSLWRDWHFYRDGSEPSCKVTLERVMRSAPKVTSNKCRLLYLVGQLGPGGLEQQLCYLLQVMNRQRYQPAVVVWNFDEADVHVPQIRALGVPLYSLPNTPSVLKLRAFRHIVRQLRPEVVHSYDFYINFGAWWATLGLKAIPIGSIRNDFITDRQLSGRILGRLNACWPPTQICNSLAAQKSVERSGLFGPTRVHLVRNGLDINRFKPHPLPQDGPSLLAIGRLYPEKRWDRLLEVIRWVAATGLEFSVRLVGDGPLLPQLKSQARQLGLEKLVQFLGFREDIPCLLKDSTFLIHTADHEGCPNAVMEAMACGRAVIGTDAGDFSVLVEDGKTGFVVPRGDNTTLVERTVKLLTDRNLCSRMGEAGRTRAEREFGLDRLVTETLAAYRAAGWGDA
jgi:glycosyltransferase involved in cell wall biosynthesis